MKKLPVSALFRSRYLLAMFAGLLLAAAFPNIGIAGLAWIAPGLLVASGRGKTGWEVFRIGYVGGLIYYLASLYWLLLIPYRWHGIPFGPAAGWLALSAYHAIYPAAWVWLLSGRRPAPSSTPSATPPEPPWAQRTLWALSGAAGWVAMEMIIARLFSGFPWNLLGASQYKLVPLIQIASITGVYGVAFVVVWFSLSLISALFDLVDRPTLHRSWASKVLLPSLVTAVLFSFGLRQIGRTDPTGRTLKTTLVQPSIPQTLIWDPSKDEQRFQELISLSEQALTNKTDLLIWPEAAVPKLLRYEKEMFESVTGLARKHRVWIIVGADDAEPRAGASGKREVDYYNSSFLISPEGKLVDRYRKRSLVIFGEYVPLARWLPFMKWFTPVEGGFTSGDKPVQYELTDLGAKVAVLICFEDTFPHLAREYPEPDTDFLVNITNNGWFGESAAQWQHAVCALFRAVENGLPLVRCSNNGLTCLVDARGRLTRIFRDSAQRVYGPGFLTVEIPLLPEGHTRGQTFYCRYGDVFGWICVGLTLVTLIMRIGKRPRQETSSSSSSSSS